MMNHAAFNKTLPPPDYRKYARKRKKREELNLDEAFLTKDYLLEGINWNYYLRNPRRSLNVRFKKDYVSAMLNVFFDAVLQDIVENNVVFKFPAKREEMLMFLGETMHYKRKMLNKRYAFSALARNFQVPELWLLNTKRISNRKKVKRIILGQRYYLQALDNIGTKYTLRNCPIVSKSL